MTQMTSCTRPNLSDVPDPNCHACKDGLVTSPGSCPTDLSRHQLPHSMQTLNFLASNRNNEEAWESNGRTKKISKMKALPCVSVKGGPDTQNGKTRSTPRLTRTSNRPQTPQIASKFTISSRKTHSCIPRTRIPRRASQVTLRKSKNNRKAQKALHTDLSSSARQLFFSLNPFSPAFLGVLRTHFDPLTFYSTVNPEYTNQQSASNVTPQVTQKSRAQILNWVLLVHRKFGLRFHTFLSLLGLSIHSYRVQEVLQHPCNS